MHNRKRAAPVKGAAQQNQRRSHEKKPVEKRASCFHRADRAGLRSGRAGIPAVSGAQPHRAGRPDRPGYGAELFVPLARGHNQPADEHTAVHHRLPGDGAGICDPVAGGDGAFLGPDRPDPAAAHDAAAPAGSGVRRGAAGRRSGAHPCLLYTSCRCRIRARA